MGPEEGDREELRRTLAQAAIEADRIARIVRELERTYPTHEEWLLATAEIGKREADFRRALNRAAAQIGLPAGARERILRYLLLRVGEPVDKEELDGVSGIQEWARRIRELRVEQGWRIASDADRDDLAPGQYMLEAPEPDGAGAGRWQLLNRIRRQPGSGRDRIRDLLVASVGAVVTAEEIDYVAGIREAPRRIRELEEAGYQIQSIIDDPTLRPGDRRLISTDLLPARKREAIKQRYAILDRDGRRCRDCGVTPGAGKVLQVHHVVPVHRAGTNDDDNLVTLCQFCHAGRHSLDASAVADELIHPEADPWA